MSGTAMLVLSAMMLATGMTVLVTMMITLYIGIEVQISGQVCLNSIVRHTGYTAVQLDSCLCQCHLCTTADSAAD